jgi:hypothetical protein
VAWKIGHWSRFCLSKAATLMSSIFISVACRSPKLRDGTDFVRVTMLQASPDGIHFKRVLDFGEG